MTLSAITTATLSLFLNIANAQDSIIINGNIPGVEEGTRIFFMKKEGNVGTTVAKDSVVNGRFRISYLPGTKETEQYSIMADGKGFPSMSLKLWASAGSSIAVEGNNKLIYTWSVKSNVPEQKEWLYFVNSNKQHWDAYQQLSVQRSELINDYRKSDATKAEKTSLKAKIDSVDNLSDKIEYTIRKNNLDLLEKDKMTPTRMEVLSGIASAIKWNKAETFRPAVTKIYSQLSSDFKNSVEGQEIALVLYPPAIVKPGEPMFDTLLKDLDGNSYHLADFKGKYILLDFWSFGCGPCHASVPEMKELHEKLKDSLTIVGLSSDNKKMWRQATDLFKMTWKNLSDGNENRGIYARYGVEGIPNYVLIAPDGIVKASWTGYGTGSLKSKVKELTGLSASIQ
ncbi:TlpA disulfide reductase family protein [Niabella yanshanensis]|uniref:TlpA disulfide reductase family protein n=1 Tax=Niabella yanshanensis TaxID=577386 RepID=A0ABZ0W559_9BACT|nr:TlpA disulfide reductase family protein [Niabella yanshanensis]WQD37647.1 TlpA disulfide reductase family protein [Niabella yanshanensis]